MFDCQDAANLARFWAALLDGYAVRPYDDESARLAEKGLMPETDPTGAVDGPGPILCFPQVSEPKRAKNRVHLDITVRDRTAEVGRLVELGASALEEFDTWTAMLDPEGNEFCLPEAA